MNAIADYIHLRPELEAIEGRALALGITCERVRCSTGNHWLTVRTAEWNESIGVHWCSGALRFGMTVSSADDPQMLIERARRVADTYRKLTAEPVESADPVPASLRLVDVPWGEL